MTDIPTNGVAVMDESNRYVRVDQSYARLCGADEPTEVEDRTWSDANPVGDGFADAPSIARGRGEYALEAANLQQASDGDSQESDGVIVLTAVDEWVVCTVLRAESIDRPGDRLETLFDNLPVPAVRAAFEDDQPIVRRVNNAFESTFGYDARTIEGELLDEYVAPTTDDDTEWINEAVRESGVFTGHVRRQTADGTQTFLLKAVLDRGKDRQEDRTPEHEAPIEGYVIYVDVTDQRRHRETLRALHDVATNLQGCDSVEEVCEAVVAAASEILEYEQCAVLIREGDWLEPTAVSEHTADGGVRRMRVDQGLAGKTMKTGDSQLLDEVEQAPEADPAKESYRSGISVPVGDRGVFQAVETEPAAFGDRDLELAELLCAHAATAIDRIEGSAEIARQKERLETFASVISHDLRNPINVAGGRLTLLEEEVDSPHLEPLEGAIDRMETLVDDILTFTREGEPVRETEPIDLDRLVGRCWSSVETGDAELVVEVDGAPPVAADRSRLAQVFENLFRNSVEHGSTGHDGTQPVEIEVGLVESDAEPIGVYVEDDGPGIPSERRSKVFETGYSTSAQGTGLGLGIVRTIVEAHGWTIDVAEGTNGGARFEITDVDWTE